MELFLKTHRCDSYCGISDTQKVIVHNQYNYYTQKNEDSVKYLCKECIQELIDKNYFITILKGETSWIKDKTLVI